MSRTAAPDTGWRAEGTVTLATRRVPGLRRTQGPVSIPALPLSFSWSGHGALCSDGTSPQGEEVGVASRAVSQAPRRWALAIGGPSGNAALRPHELPGPSPAPQPEAFATSTLLYRAGPWLVLLPAGFPDLKPLSPPAQQYAQGQGAASPKASSSLEDSIVVSLAGCTVVPGTGCRADTQ